MKTIKERAEEYATRIWPDDFPKQRNFEFGYREGVMAERTELTRWNRPKEAPMPEFDGQQERQCLIVRKGYTKIELAYYDFRFQSWNDADNDDNLCSMDQIEKWRPIH